MAPSKSLAEDLTREPSRLHHIARGCSDSLKSCSLPPSQERDLPPLPNDLDFEDEVSQPNNRRPPFAQGTYSNSSTVSFKIPPPSLIPPLGTPSRHDLVFPAYKSSPALPRPKLRLETGWDSTQLVHPHSAVDASSTSSFRQRSRAASATSQDCLLFPSPEDLAYHHPSSIQDLRNTKAPTSPRSSANCRLLGAVRLQKIPSIVRAAHKKTITTRGISDYNATIILKPFIRSDGNPNQGITVTVQRQRLVSEPMPTFSCPSSISLLSVAASTLSVSSADKPLPTPAESYTKELPTIPPSDDDHHKPTVPIAGTRNAPDSNSESIIPPATIHKERQPVGAKRRKHYRVHRVSVPLS
ncbi:hypothetical protein DFH07DRAFT_340932 [Mycena maculata]|uniref:Uncharacterized protein n=1 Tax=Mycena maculata TaxID=230809 RepID=A0AAD7MHV7_9AGAR|nr:hypothetical protein DFH07DRAFT_340932 [Mycena maculata]